MWHTLVVFFKKIYALKINAKGLDELCWYQKQRDIGLWSLGIALGFCVFWSWVLFLQPKRKASSLLVGCERSFFFQRITEEDKGGSQLNISLPTLLFFSCSRRRLSSRGNWKKRIPSFDWLHNSLYVVALTSTPKLFTGTHHAKALKVGVSLQFS
jgi:hypothetical protein